MILKQFKPFWSYDITKTENWLTSMAAKGWHFAELNIFTRQFFFEKGEPNEATFRIQYDKTAEVPVSIEDSGWEYVYQRRKWNILRNQDPASGISAFPVRDGIIKRNYILRNVFGGIFLYHLFTFIIFLFITGSILLSSEGGSFKVVGSPFWILTITAWILMWTFVPYSAFKLHQSVKQLSDFSKATDFEMLPASKTGSIITKWKFGWNYEPDKLEQWLEEMEQAGYNLMRISTAGLKFHFVQGTPRNVSYCVDFQNTRHQHYFDIHKEAGWLLMYTSGSFQTKWAIWAKEYQDDEEPPQLYSDSEHMLKHGRRIALTNFAIFGPIIVTYIGLIVMNINLAQTRGMDTLDWTIIILFGIVIIEDGWLLMKSGFYYRRMKHRHKNK